MVSNPLVTFCMLNFPLAGLPLSNTSSADKPRYKYHKDYGFLANNSRENGLRVQAEICFNKTVNLYFMKCIRPIIQFSVCYMYLYIYIFNRRATALVFLNGIIVETDVWLGVCFSDHVVSLKSNCCCVLVPERWLYTMFILSATLKNLSPFFRLSCSGTVLAMASVLVLLCF